MKVQDFLRALIDKLDGATPASHQPNAAHLTIVTPAEPEIHQDNNNPTMNVDTMVPPLQQKMELLKKAVGVDSVFDTDSEPDELEVIKSLAGMNPGAAAAFTAGEDNDIVG
jgi:hypothetical protein